MKQRRPPAGTAPGTLFRGPQQPAKVTLYACGGGAHLEREVGDVTSLRALRGVTDRVHWVDVQGLDDHATLEALREALGIHPLALADAVNTPQRPKAETYPEHLLIVTQMVRNSGDGFTVEQLSVVVSQGLVVTFQEREYGDVLDPVRQRMKSGGIGPAADQLAHAIVDTVVDGYYPVLEQLGESLQAIEDDVLQSPRPATLERIQRTKRRLLHLRRGLWPQRDALASLLREPTPLLGEAARLNLRDAYDHAVQLIDMLETYRELAASAMDAYLSSLSHRLNEVMRVLTVISTIFIPLSFIAGVYGMNFRYMPELEWRWGYFLVLGLMLAAGVSMLGYFYRRGWLFGPAQKAVRRRRRGGP